MSNIGDIPHGLTVYPWRRWTDGKLHRARAGKHFTSSSEAFRRALQMHARRHKLKVTTRVQRGSADQPDRVVFQFSKPKPAKSKGSK